MGVGEIWLTGEISFFRNKGFSAINHIPSGDDDLLINRVANKHNTSIVVDPEAFTLSKPKQTWKDWRRQKDRHYSTGKFFIKSRTSFY